MWVGLLAGIWATVVALSAAAQEVPELERQARGFFDQERYAEARDVLQTILNADPGNRTANVLLSFTLARLDRADEAVLQSRRALDRLPTNTKLELLLAGLLAQQDATRPEAIQRYRRVLQRDPENVLARTGLAEALRAQGLPFDAIQEFGQVAERVPDDARYPVRLGQLYAVLGDLGESRSYFERAYALRRDNVDAVRSLAILGDVEDRPQDALRYYRELLGLYPMDVSVRLAVRASEERLGEASFPIPITDMEKAPLERYASAVPTNSKQLQHRREQIDALRWRSYTRFLPSFFYAPSKSITRRTPAPEVFTRDDTESRSLSFGWSLADIFANPYSANITGAEADFESIRANLVADVTTTYYQRLQNILEYRRLQQALALNPQNAQLRQSKQVAKYTILNLTERLKILTGMP